MAGNEYLKSQSAAVGVTQLNLVAEGLSQLECQRQAQIKAGLIGGGGIILVLQQPLLGLRRRGFSRIRNLNADTILASLAIQADTTVVGPLKREIQQISNNGLQQLRIAVHRDGFAIVVKTNAFLQGLGPVIRDEPV